MWLGLQLGSLSAWEFVARVCWKPGGLGPHLLSGAGKPAVFHMQAAFLAPQVAV